MTARPARRIAGALLLLLSAAISPSPGRFASAEPPAANGTLSGWTSLTLGAEKAVVFSASAVLSVSEGTHAGTGRPAVVFKTRSSASVLGATGFQEETTSWIDTEKRRPIEFFQLRPADSARRYLFLDGLVRQTSWEPPEGNRSEEFSRWREVETSDKRFTYADGRAPAAGESLTDVYSLIYLMRGLDLSAEVPAPHEFVTLYRRHLIRLRVVPGERRSNERIATNEATGATETLKLRERRVKIKPLGEGAGSFKGLLGMQGDTEIWLDEDSGAPVELDGEAPGLGYTQVSLRSFRR